MLTNLTYFARLTPISLGTSLTFSCALQLAPITVFFFFALCIHIFPRFFLSTWTLDIFPRCTCNQPDFFPRFTARTDYRLFFLALCIHIFQRFFLSTWTLDTLPRRTCNQPEFFPRFTARTDDRLFFPCALRTYFPALFFCPRDLWSWWRYRNQEAHCKRGSCPLRSPNSFVPKKFWKTRRSWSRGIVSFLNYFFLTKHVLTVCVRSD